MAYCILRDSRLPSDLSRLICSYTGSTTNWRKCYRRVVTHLRTKVLNGGAGGFFYDFNRNRRLVNDYYIKWRYNRNNYVTMMVPPGGLPPDDYEWKLAIEQSAYNRRIRGRNFIIRRRVHAQPTSQMFFTMSNSQPSPNDIATQHISVVLCEFSKLSGQVYTSTQARCQPSQKNSQTLG